MFWKELLTDCSKNFRRSFRNKSLRNVWRNFHWCYRINSLRNYWRYSQRNPLGGRGDGYPNCSSSLLKLSISSFEDYPGSSFGNGWNNFSRNFGTFFQNFRWKIVHCFRKCFQEFYRDLYQEKILTVYFGKSTEVPLQFLLELL